MSKKNIFAFMLIVAVTSNSFFAKGQSGWRMDSLYINKFDLTKSEVKPSAINTLLLGESAFIKKFGNPLKISVEYSEENECKMKHYFYKGAEAWYTNDALHAFSISSPDYSLQLLKGGSIKVGDNISCVMRFFPCSWEAKPFPNQVFVSLRNQKTLVDMSLLFLFNPNTHLITTISVQ
jgi:hypothetical protein